MNSARFIFTHISRIPHFVFQLLNYTIFSWKKLSAKNRYLLLVGVFASFLILIPIALSTLFNSDKAEAAWWNDSWGYRQTVSVTSSSALTDYQIAITLDTASLITAGKMQTDCNDIRVTDLKGNVLPHWIEGGAPGCNDAATEIWVKAPLIPTSGQTLFIYYGNSSAVNTENPNKLFLLFDNFKNIDVSKWNDTTGTNTIALSGYDNKAVNTVNDANDIRFYSKSIFSGGYAVKARMREDGADGGIFFDSQNDANGYLIASRRGGGTNAFQWYKRASGAWGGVSLNNTVSSWTSTEFRTLEISRVGTGIVVKDNETTVTYDLSTDASYSSGSIGIRGSSEQTIDWIFVKKAVATEPTVGSPTNEEKSQGPVAYWKFDEGYGTSINDSSTNKINGSIGNIVWENEDQCISGKCLRMNQNSSISIPSNNLLDITNAIAISVWIKPVTISGVMPILNRAIFQSPYSGFSLELHDGKPTIFINGGRGAGTVQRCNQQVEANKFSHISWTRDGSNVNKIFINGTECTYSSSVSASQTSVSTTLGIGSKLGKHNLPPYTDYSNRNYGQLYTAGSWGGDAGDMYYYATGGYDDLPYKKLNKTAGGTGGSYLDDNQYFSIQDNRSYIVSAWMKVNRNESGMSTHALNINRPSDNAYRLAAGSFNLTTDWQRISWIYNSSTGHAGSYYTRNIIYVDTNLPLETYWSGLQVEDITNTDQTSPTSKFSGYIDEIKIYNYARSAEQIKLDYASRGSVKGTSSSIGNDLVRQGSLANGLVGYWKQDEATWSGTLSEVIDSSGNGNHGQAQGATGGKAYPTTGKFGNGGFFNGVDDYVSIPDNANLQFGTGNFSVSAWIKSTNGGTVVAIGKYAGSGDDYWLGFSNGKATFSNSGTAATETSASANNGSWHLLTGVKSNGTINIYVDGVLAKSAPDSNTASPTGYLGIGKFGSGSNFFWPGQIDELRVYNRALSPAEVSALYNYAPGPVGYWNFEEGSGGSVNDKSGNGYNATFVGSSSWIQGKYGKGASTDSSISDYVNAPNVDLPNGDWTIMSWFKYPLASTGANYNTLFRGNSIDHQILVRRSDKQLGVFDNTGGVFVGCGFIVSTLSSDWHHIAAVGTGSVQNFYIDGVYKCQSAFKSVSDIKAIGNYQGGSQNWGKFDEVKVYNYARTAGQIVEDMNAGHPIGGSPIGSQLLYLKLDEGYGSTSKSQVNGYIFDHFNSPTWINDGKFGKAIDFDGLNDHLRADSSDPFEYRGEDYTISTWFYPHDGDTDGGWIISKPWNGSGQYNYTFKLNSNKTLTFSLVGTTDWTGTTTKTLTTNSWHHIAVAIESSTKNVKIYFDGKQVYSGTHTITSWTPTSGDSNIRLSIGCLYPYGTWAGATAHCVKGKIDEVKIYSATLTADQIKLDYNQGKALVLGSFGTDSDGKTASNSASRVYCVPGDTSNCNPPVAEWNFEEKQGSTANDTSGNSLTGTWGGTAPYWTQGKYGTGGNFNGTDSRVSIAHSTLLKPTSAITISAWVSPVTNSLNTLREVYRKEDGSDRELLSFQNTANCSGGGGTGGCIAFGISTGGAYAELDVNIAATDWTNGWHYLTAVYDGASKAIYRDGVQIGSAVASGAIGATGTANAYIGSSSGSSEFFKGKIDQVKIFNYARTPAQIAWDYNQGKPIAHWKLDECQGGVANDSSGNGNHGTITIGGTGTQTSVGTCQTSNTAWYNGASGKYNSSLNFDGVDDYVSTAANWSNKFSNGITISAWVNFPNFTNYNRVVTIEDSAGTGYDTFIQAKQTSAIVQFGSGGAGKYKNGTTALSPNTWYHIVGVTDYTSGGTKIYVNGRDDGGTVNGTPTYTATKGTLDIGRLISGTPYYGSGQIDDVRIYNYALTPLQVKNVMNQGSAVRWGPNAGQP
jgi:hypothetical protein